MAFDLDGTLFVAAPEVDYEDRVSVRAHVKPDLQACERVQELVLAGHRVAYVTGRSEKVRGVTSVQIAVQARLPAGRLLMQPSWRGYGVMATWKGVALLELGASLYVGDHEADWQAAVLAGIPFVHARDFREKGVLLEA